MIPGELQLKRCQRTEDHRAHEPYVERPDGPELACPGGPPDVLTAVVIANRDLVAARRALDEAVRRARLGRYSYAAIGEVLGVSRQAVWERFHALEDAS